MTRAIKSALRAYDYTDEQIAQLTPQEAHKILMGKGARPSCPLRSTFGAFAQHMAGVAPLPRLA
jgi:hypothetical protein